MLYNEASRSFVMWVHVDEADYELARMGIATSARPQVLAHAAHHASVSVSSLRCRLYRPSHALVTAPTLTTALIRMPLGAGMAIPLWLLCAGPVRVPWQLPATRADGARLHIVQGSALTRMLFCLMPLIPNPQIPSWSSTPQWPVNASGYCFAGAAHVHDWA